MDVYGIKVKMKKSQVINMSPQIFKSFHILKSWFFNDQVTKLMELFPSCK